MRVVVLACRARCHDQYCRGFSGHIQQVVAHLRLEVHNVARPELHIGGFLNQRDVPVQDVDPLLASVVDVMARCSVRLEFESDRRELVLTDDAAQRCVRTTGAGIGERTAGLDHMQAVLWLLTDKLPQPHSVGAAELDEQTDRRLPVATFDAG